MYTYPTPVDNLPAILALPGNFWPGIYGGADLVYDYCQCTLTSENQLWNDLQELIATISRQTCPVYHNENWYILNLLQSQAIINAPPGTKTTFPVPATLQGAQLLVDNFTSPNVALVNGVDYFLNTTNNTITFNDNPFVDTAYTPQPVTVNGVTTDHTIQLFFANAQIDWQFIYQQFGYLLGINLSSSQNYKNFIVALLNCTTGGTTYLNLVAALAAIADAPYVLTNGEVVQTLGTDVNGSFVITNINVYRYYGNLIVSVGQTLNAGDFVDDTITIFQPMGGNVPGISSLVVPNSMLDPSIAGPLTFNNSSTPLTVTLNVSGYTKVSWSLGGAGGDVTQFFNVLHTKGIAAGKTLAMLLDQRPQPQATQPVASNLPSTINPLVFLCQNVLRNNAFIVTLNSSTFGPNALGTVNLSFLRQVIPPGTGLISIVN